MGWVPELLPERLGLFLALRINMQNSNDKIRQAREKHLINLGISVTMGEASKLVDVKSLLILNARSWSEVWIRFGADSVSYFGNEPLVKNAKVIVPFIERCKAFEIARSLYVECWEVAMEIRPKIRAGPAPNP